MRVIFDHDRCVLFHGDSSELKLAENSVDAIVCDPPSGIAFMNRTWDTDKGGRDAWIDWLARTLAPAYRALKPGGHGLFWALPRTSHWTGMALETTGFEIRDRVSHLFLSGFPKSLNVAKQFAKSDALVEVKNWDGWGTALKPSIEDWWLVRKPLENSVAANVLKHGTGAINIGSCRIGEEILYNHPARNTDGAIYNLGVGADDKVEGTTSKGRWPTHLAVSHHADCVQVGTKEDEHVVRIGEKLADDSRELAFGMGRQTTTTTTTTTIYACHPDCPVRDMDARGIKDPARYFYCPKPPKSETEIGLDHLPLVAGAELTDRKAGSAGLKNPRAGAGRTSGARNLHPTKKPIALMDYLIKLVTPPGGVVLDPFAGSGTTGVAALSGGWSFIGCEQGGGEGDPYLPILLGRIRHALGLPGTDAPFEA